MRYLVGFFCFICAVAAGFLWSMYVIDFDQVFSLNKKTVTEEVHHSEEVIHQDDEYTQEEQVIMQSDFEEKQPKVDIESVQEPEKIPTKKIWSLTGNEQTDAYIQKLAEARGYQKRELANNRDLVIIQGRYIHRDIAQPLQDMQKQLLQDTGHDLVFVSGFRSFAQQKDIFLAKLGKVRHTDIIAGEYDEKINSILSVNSLPGYSKHHTGFAVDFGCDSRELSHSFKETPCFAWLVDHDYFHARQFGFVPSYPDTESHQGPDPESWEYIWIGNQQEE